MPRKTNRPRKPVSRFDKLATKLAQRPGIYSPRGLAATIGRRKYGAAGMAALAARGRSGNPGAHQRMLELEYKVRHGGLDLTPRESHELRLLYDALGVPPLHRIDLTTGRDKKALEWEVRRHRGENPDISGSGGLNLPHGGDTTTVKAGRESNPFGPSKLGQAVVKSDNEKTGVVTATYASQASCPDGKNSSYRCALYGKGCYAESGNVGARILPGLNRSGGVSHTGKSDPVDPVLVARDEAAAIESIYKEWNKTPGILGLDKLAFRVHVVGDCVTPECAHIVGRAAVKFDFNAGKNVKPVWTYTHAWKDVSRSDWPSRMSVLASCDTIADAKRAFGQGWGVAVVVPVFLQVALKRFGATYPVEGINLIPCPSEVNRVVESSELELVKAAARLLGIKLERPAPAESNPGKKAKGKAKGKAKKEKKEPPLTLEEMYNLLPTEVRKDIDKAMESAHPGKSRPSRKVVQCNTCRLCWRDEWLHDSQSAIAFAAHTPKSKIVAAELIKIDVKQDKGDKLDPVLLNMQPGDTSYADVLDRIAVMLRSAGEVREQNPPDDAEDGTAFEVLADVQEDLIRRKEAVYPLGEDRELYLRAHSDGDVSALVRGTEGGIFGAEVIVPAAGQIQDVIHYALHHHTLAGWEPGSNGYGPDEGEWREENPASPVVQEIVRQLSAAGLVRRGIGLVAMDDATLKINKGLNGATIHYDRGADLYDVQVYHAYMDRDPVHEDPVEGLDVEQMVDLIGRLLSGKRTNPGWSDPEHEPEFQDKMHRAEAAGADYARQYGRVDQVVVRKAFEGYAYDNFSEHPKDSPLYIRLWNGWERGYRNYVLGRAGNPARYELFYNDGGHGGPYISLDQAIRRAKQLIAGSSSTTSITIHPYSATGIGGYGPAMIRVERDKVRALTDQADRLLHGAGVTGRDDAYRVNPSDTAGMHPIYSVGPWRVYEVADHRLKIENTATGHGEYPVIYPTGKVGYDRPEALPAHLKQFVARYAARRRSNPSAGYDYRDKFDAFSAGKEFRTSGAYNETGVANARVARYGFHKWLNNQPKSVVKAKTRLMKEFMEGWAAGKRIEAREGNPASGAAAKYEEFHGVPSEEEVVVTEEVRYHGNLAGLGDLVEIVVKTPSGYKAVLDFDKSGTILCCSEDGKQLYLRGGDQAIDLAAIKMNGDGWIRDSMVLGKVLKMTYRTAKKFDDLQVLDYEHKLGEESGVRPELIYDVLNNQLSVAGGQYDVLDVGITN